MRYAKSHTRCQNANPSLANLELKPRLQRCASRKNFGGTLDSGTPHGARATPRLAQQPFLLLEDSPSGTPPFMGETFSLHFYALICRQMSSARFPHYSSVYDNRGEWRVAPRVQYSAKEKPLRTIRPSTMTERGGLQE